VEITCVLPAARLAAGDYAFCLLYQRAKEN